MIQLPMPISYSVNLKEQKPARRPVTRYFLLKLFTVKSLFYRSIHDHGIVPFEGLFCVLLLLMF